MTKDKEKKIKPQHHYTDKQGVVYWYGVVSWLKGKPLKWLRQNSYGSVEWTIIDEPKNLNNLTIVKN